MILQRLRHSAKVHPVQPGCLTEVWKLKTQISYRELTYVACAVIVVKGNVFSYDCLKEFASDAQSDSFGCDSKKGISDQRADCPNAHENNPSQDIIYYLFLSAGFHRVNCFADKVRKEKVSNTS